MKINLRYKLFISGSILLLASCVKDDLHNTPHPGKGAVVITTDWTTRSLDAVLPGSYLLRVGTEEQTVSGETNAFNSLFLPGRQDLLVCHPADGITISGTSATVNTLPDGTLESLPGYLFSASSSLEIAEDDTLNTTVAMRQRIRRLTLVLKLTPGDETRIRCTTAMLTGIASTVDLATGTVSATEAETVVPIFAMETYTDRTRAAAQPQLSATLRLLGVATDERQMLTLTLTLTDGHVQPLATDLTEALKNFGTDIAPLTLDATLELPTPAGIGGSITDWTVVNNGNIEIDLKL